MLTRRDIFRGLGLSVLAVGAVGILDACGESSSPGPGGATDGSGLTLAASDVKRMAPDAAAIAAGVASMQGLGAGLWGELAGEGGNLAISPFSVAVALGMTVNGARGRTAVEMLDVLSGESAGALNAGYNAVAQYVESLAGPVERWEEDDAEIALDTANSLFGQRGVEWESAFLDALAASYGAGVQQVDYVADVEAARAAINGWTAEQTRDKIPELIPAGILDAMTRLVLVNALYLKAPWETPFEESLTQDGLFTPAGGEPVMVPMMKGPEPIPGGAGDGWRSAQIRYAGRTLAMTVVLPEEGREADVEALLADAGAGAFLGVGSDTVDLTMPRWTFRAPSPLKDALMAMGMPTAFGAADFSAMNADIDLVISEVLHEVFIAVDEKGTEAAAATAVLMSETSMPQPGAPLVLDRPFLFVIHDLEHGTPLFIGRVADPS
jgi:serpin B